VSCANNIYPLSINWGGAARAAIAIAAIQCDLPDNSAEPDQRLTSNENDAIILGDTQQQLENYLWRARFDIEQKTERQKQQFNALLDEHTKSPFLQRTLANAALQVQKPQQTDIVQEETALKKLAKRLWAAIPRSTTPNKPEDSTTDTFDWAEVLTAKKEGIEYLVGDELFLNFLEWHNYQLARQQKEIDSQVELLKMELMTEINEMIECGYLPESAGAHCDKLNKVQVYIDDGTLMKAKNERSISIVGTSYINTRTGEHEIGLLCNKMEDCRYVIRHELIHTINGSIPQEYREGVFREVIGARFLSVESALNASMPKPINEALTEHLNSCLDHGDFNLIDPDLREKKYGEAYESTYRTYRKLLSILIASGQKQLNLRDFYDLYFLNSQNPQAEQQIQNVYNQLQQAWPDSDIINKISNLRADAEGIFEENVQELINELST